MLRVLIDRLDSIQKQMENVGSEMEILIKQNKTKILEIQNTQQRWEEFLQWDNQ